MEREKSSGLFLIPFIYATLILAFLFIHFSQFEHFSREMKNAWYSGTITRGRGIKPSRITKLVLNSNGLELNFSGRSPLTMITEDGIRRDLSIQEISRDENSLRVQFKYDTAITFKTDPRSSNTSMEFTVPQTRPPVRELQLNARVADLFQLNRDGDSQQILSDGTSSFFLHMDQDFTLDEEKNLLTIFMNDRTSTVLMLEDEAPGLGRSIREWLAENQEITPGNFADSVQNYRTAAYNGFKSRYDYNSGRASLPDGSTEFNETGYVYFISEALRRNEYGVILPDLLGSIEKNSSQFTWYSSPFTGDIVNKGAPILRQDPADLMEKISTLTIQGNPEESPYKEVYALQKMLREKEEEDYEAWIEENLYPLIIWLEEGLFLFHPENPVCDIRLNLLAADLILKAGEAEESESLIQTGRKILITLLEKADQEGFLPAEITFSREHPSLESGFVRPETVLKLFPRQEFSPRFVDISDYTGKDSWIFTAAESVRITSSDEGLDIDLNYPRGQIHHVILKGIKPYDRILLHSIVWKSDPRFQRYSDGWVYDSVNQTLYVKIRQRAARETISIRYSPEAPETPEPADQEENSVAAGEETPQQNGQS